MTVVSSGLVYVYIVLLGICFLLPVAASVFKMKEITGAKVMGDIGRGSGVWMLLDLTFVALGTSGRFMDWFWFCLSFRSTKNVL